MMVAYDPRLPPDHRRMLSADVADRLRLALIERWEKRSEDDSVLRAALQQAVNDAKQRQLRPEELLIALKAVEERVVELLPRVDLDERDRFRHWVVGVCMRAYFGDDPVG